MLPYLQLILCALLWGLAGPIIRWSELPSLSVIVIRFSLPLLLSYAVLRWIERTRPQPITWALFAVSVLTVLANAAYACAFAFTTISNVLLILYTRPVLTTLMASLILGEHVPRQLWGLLLIAFLGVAIIMSEHQLSFADSDLIGMLLALVTAALSGLSWAIVKKYNAASSSPTQVIFHQHLVGGLLALLWLPFVIQAAPVKGLAIASLYPILVGFVALQLYFSALKVVPLSRTMPITYLEPVVAVLVGVLCFGEQITLKLIVGGALILCGAAGTIGLSIAKPGLSRTRLKL